MDLLWTADSWANLVTLGASLGEKAIRSIAVYAALLLFLRILGRRELAQVSPLDLVLFLMLSNTVQNAIIGSDNSLTGGLFGAAVLIAANVSLGRLTARFPALDRSLFGSPHVLVRDGQAMMKELGEAGLTLEKLDEEICQLNIGLEGHGKAKRVTMYSDGKLAVLPMEDTGGQDLADRLSRIEQQLATLIAQRHS